MIEARALRVRFGAAEVVRGVDIVGPPGTAVGLVGPNGAGKTTTLKAIVGLYKHEGRVLLDGRDITHLGPRQRAAAGIGYSPEDRGLFPSLTVMENLLVPIKALRLPQERLEVALQYVEEVKRLLDRGAGQLSGGQQKLVALARAIVVGRRALLLDEVFEGIAPKLADTIKLYIREYVEREKAAAILAESTTTYLRGLATTIYHIDRGTITATKNL